MLEIKSFAKINIGLQVISKRKDGYHNINTVFAKIDLADTISFKKSDELEVLCTPELDIPQEDNLVYKAIKKLQKRIHKVEDGIRIDIKKNIPTGGGLGGGSSNAAYAMLGYLKFLGLESRTKESQIIAPLIGSDVPYFLSPGWAIGKGKGELLDHFRFKLPLQILIINPKIHINTGLAYDGLKRSDKPLPILNYKNLLNKSYDNPTLLKEYFKNDFEKTVFRDYKVLKDIKSNLYEMGAVYASISGSGSTMFGLFEKGKDLNEILSFYKDYYTKICNFVTE